MHSSPGPIQQIVLCRVSEVRGPLYIRIDNTGQSVLWPLLRWALRAEAMGFQLADAPQPHACYATGVTLWGKGLTPLFLRLAKKGGG